MVAVKGSCPVMTFSVAGTMIWMDSTTVLNGLSCAQLMNGTIVRVSGFRRQDGRSSRARSRLRSGNRVSRRRG